ncbi:hypothetical protein [Streptomyces sp. AC555_RSS877]|nr:hypothetical protein [Streptomyces sp. AC555_RSS877]
MHLAWGEHHLVETGERAVLAHVCRAGDGTVLAVTTSRTGPSPYG